MRHLLLVENGTVFDEGVVSILGQEPDWTISRFTYTDDIEFRDLVSRAHPEIILLNETGPVDPSRVFDLLDADPELGAARVILIRAGSNMLDVYNRRTVVATQRDDLVSLIRTSLDSNPQGGTSTNSYDYSH